MSTKRISNSDSTAPSKKIKVEYCHPLTPFDIEPLLKIIANYMEGDHLENFKLTCKKFNQITQGKSCIIKITPENFPRTTSTPGYHLMKIDRTTEYGLVDHVAFKEHSYSEVKHLTLDFCGLGGTPFPLISQPFIDLFKDLHTLRIIRSKEDIDLKINGLSSLEIYTSGYINLEIKKRVEKALLCSTERYIMGKPNISIQIPAWSLNDCVSGFKCNAYGSRLQYGKPEHRFSDHHFESFVPNPKLL